MKVRDSGMPEEDDWNNFFDAECVIKKMFGEKGCQGNLVEFGSGYGTFTLAVAKYLTGTVLALDICIGFRYRSRFDRATSSEIK